MLQRLRVESVRSLREVEIELGRLTVVVGPNGCGKSTLLDQLQFVCDATRPGNAHNNLFGSAGRLLDKRIAALATHESAAPTRWQAVGEDGARLCITVLEPRDPSWFESASVEAAAGGRELRLNQGSPPDDRAAMDALLANGLGWRAQRLALVPDDIGTPVDVRVRSMQPSGYGLPALLAGLAQNDQAAYAALQRDLRAVVPQFEQLQLRTVDVPEGEERSVGGVAVSMKMRGAGVQPARAISDGTLLTLALLTATHHPDMPPLVLMDDVDHGLHPKAQWALVDALRKVMEVRPELQVVCTTHSPYLLDAFAPEEVRVMALNEQGHAVLSPLTRFPDFQRARRGLQTGEFWAAAGEDWVTDGEPAGE